MDEITVSVPRKIENDIEGFEFFIELYKTFKESYGKKIILDFNKTRWLEANLSAILGAILSFGLVNNKIAIKRVSKSISKILIRNKFFKCFGIGENLDDLYETTIRYEQFDENDKVLVVNGENNYRRYVRRIFWTRIYGISCEYS